MKKKVRLSQCMIVKNEERNIKKALSWAKDIAFEQIVVDTGSTDHTVEIAKEMGAKVYQFEWNDDFSAAKNYAIEQASGNWIAFLDADEYLLEKDAHTLMTILNRVESIKTQKETIHFLRCKLVNLNDQGKPFAVTTQDRIFRNLPDLRYHGRIHEQIVRPGGLHCLNTVEHLTIFHTGYSNRSYVETKKASRNIDLMRKELKQNPENYNIWSYMGDSYIAETKYQEAIECYQKVLSESQISTNITKERFFSAGFQLLRLYTDLHLNKEEPEILGIAKKLDYPDTPNPDIHYHLGKWFLFHENYEQARTELETGLKKLETYTGIDVVWMKGELEQVYIYLAGIYQKLNQPHQVVHYSVLVLRMNPWNSDVLTQLLVLFKQESEQQGNDSATWLFLQKLYQFDRLKDQLFVLKCAKSAGFIALEERIFRLLPEEEKKELQQPRASLTSSQENEFGLQIENYIDLQFVEWASYIYHTESAELIESIKKSLENLKSKGRENYLRYVEYYATFPLWGTLHPEKNDFQTFQLRVNSMKEHLEDFIWLYQRLADYRSKEVLLAIVRSWTYFDIEALARVIEQHPAYFDLNLIPSAKDEVFVDVGAYIGDTLLQFVKVYGADYKKIFAYEVSPDILPHLQRNVQKLHDVEICGKGAGKNISSMLIKKNAQDASANRLVFTPQAESEAEMSEVDVVPLDFDLKEPVSWIKMDIEGAEEDALLGCKKIIQETAPKLSICTYHGYEDIWKLPRLIDQLNPSYHFYMRYYGGNLIPTEFVLTALTQEK